jgi:DNA topoisomerase VI subunit A
VAEVAKYSSPLDAIIGLTESTTKTWTKQRKAEERDRNARANRNIRMLQSDRVTIRDAAFQVMKEAYQKASSNGTLPVNARQIYYAARRHILTETGNDALSSSYFLQVILRDYMDENDCSDWNIVWDSRGHFTEPHTDTIIPLGTLEVREYLGERPILGNPIEVNSSELYPTKGPEHRYKSVLFIEKEGFDPLLEAAHIAERFDVGIMSTKGMSVGAARLLLDRLVNRGVERVLVLTTAARSR